MAAIVTQDIFATPIVANTGQQALLTGKVTSVSGVGPTAQYTVTATPTGTTGDLVATIVVGPKQVSTITHGPVTSPSTPSQDVFGTSFGTVSLGVNGGDTVLVRGTIGGITGTGAAAAITFSANNNGNIGDLSNTCVVGPKQLRVVQTS